MILINKFMPIKTLEIKDCYVLKNQTIELHPKRNLICGNNGSGKTTLFNHIQENFAKDSHISQLRRYSLSADVYKIQNLISSNDFANIYNKDALFQEYQVVVKMFSNIDLIKKCNEFFCRSGLVIRINENIVDTKLLTFTRSGTKTLLLLKDLSKSEKVLFLIFLISNLENTPEVLLFDNFDFEFVEYRFEKYNSINYKEEDMGFTYIFRNLFKNSQVFVITHTARRFLFYPEDAKCFFIRNGLFEINQ